MLKRFHFPGTGHVNIASTCLRCNKPIIEGNISDLKAQDSILAVMHGVPLKVNQNTEMIIRGLHAPEINSSDGTINTNQIGSLSLSAEKSDMASYTPETIEIVRFIHYNQPQPELTNFPNGDLFPVKIKFYKNARIVSTLFALAKMTRNSITSIEKETTNFFHHHCFILEALENSAVNHKTKIMSFRKDDSFYYAKIKMGIKCSSLLERDNRTYAAIKDAFSDLARKHRIETPPVFLCKSIHEFKRIFKILSDNNINCQSLDAIIAGYDEFEIKVVGSVHNNAFHSHSETEIMFTIEAPRPSLYYDDKKLHLPFTKLETSTTEEVLALIDMLEKHLTSADDKISSENKFLLTHVLVPHTLVINTNDAKRKLNPFKRKLKD